ncbi:MAG: DUF169 domain-containing protein [Candidatus Helarchaeota archaeon]
MNQDLSEYHAIGKKIENYIRPATFPLAVKLIRTEAEIPKGAKRPHQELKTKNFICQNFKMARTYGWTIGITEEDCNCLLARAVYGWDPITPETREWKAQFEIGLYAKNEQTAQKIEPHLYLLNNEFKGLVISPVSWTKIEPDVILIYCLPAQAMRFIQSYLYFEGGVLEFTSAGRIGSCHVGVSKTYLTKKPQLVLLGNGDRV